MALRRCPGRGHRRWDRCPRLRRPSTASRGLPLLAARGQPGGVEALCRRRRRGRLADGCPPVRAAAVDGRRTGSRTERSGHRPGGGDRVAATRRGGVAPGAGRARHPGRPRPRLRLLGPLDRRRRRRSTPAARGARGCWSPTEAVTRSRSPPCCGCTGADRGELALTEPRCGRVRRSTMGAPGLRTLTASTAAVAVLAGCTADTADTADTAGDRAQPPRPVRDLGKDYAFTVRAGCGERRGVFGYYRVTVRNGKVVTSTPLDLPPPSSPRARPTALADWSTAARPPRAQGAERVVVQRSSGPAVQRQDGAPGRHRPER